MTNVSWTIKFAANLDGVFIGLLCKSMSYSKYKIND